MLRRLAFIALALAVMPLLLGGQSVYWCKITGQMDFQCGCAEPERTGAPGHSVTPAATSTDGCCDCLTPEEDPAGSQHCCVVSKLAVPCLTPPDKFQLDVPLALAELLTWNGIQESLLPVRARFLERESDSPPGIDPPLYALNSAYLL